MMLRKRNLNVENVAQQKVVKRRTGSKVCENGMDVDEVDPCPEYDFDYECRNDPNSLAEYASGIFRYYKAREKFFRVGNYFLRQPHISVRSRAIVVDWIVELQEHFELTHETIYLTIKLLDTYLDRAHYITRDKLQLIACAAVFVSAKFDERQAPLIDDLTYISHDKFDRDQLMEMERDLLRTIDFDLGSPLSYRFLRRFSRVSGTDISVLTLARYILETSLMFLDFCRVSESHLAAAALWLAFSMSKANAWAPVLVKYTGYVESSLQPLGMLLNHMVIKSRRDYGNLVAVYKKYSHEIFYSVALIEPLPDVYSSHHPIEVPAEFLPCL